MHNYGNIDNESALVTSQFHIGDSPKAINDLSHSERLETTSKNADFHSRPRKLHESQSLIEFGNMQLNNHLLPSISINCNSAGVFSAILQEGLSYNFHCVMREASSLVLLHTEVDPLCTKLYKNLCQTQIPSQSTNGIISVKFRNQKIHVDALSGNYKLNEDVVIAIAAAVRRYNTSNKEFETVDDMNHANPFGIEATAILNAFQQLGSNPTYVIRLGRIKTMIEAISKPTRQQLGQAMQECSQLAMEFLQYFKEKVRRHYHIYYMLAVEKAVFEEVHGALFELYLAMNQNLEEKFRSRRSLILERTSPEEAMEFLEIKKKHRLVEQFRRAIEELNHIDKVSNPRDKLRCIQHMLCQLKAAVYESINEELVTMDDELPIIIYIVLMSEFQSGYAQVAYVEEFCNTDPTIENEKRTVTTIRVSLDYISHEWAV